MLPGSAKPMENGLERIPLVNVCVSGYMHAIVFICSAVDCMLGKLNLSSSLAFPAQRRISKCVVTFYLYKDPYSSSFHGFREERRI